MFEKISWLDPDSKNLEQDLSRTWSLIYKCVSGHQGCAWTGFLIFWIRNPAASNRIRSEPSFALAGAGLDFVLTESTMLVVGLTYIYLESSRTRIACFYLVPDLDLKFAKQSCNRTQNIGVRTPPALLVIINL